MRVLLVVRAQAVGWRISPADEAKPAGDYSRAAFGGADRPGEGLGAESARGCGAGGLGQDILVNVRRARTARPDTGQHRWRRQRFASA